MKHIVISMLIALLPVSTSAGLFEMFSDVCLAPVLSDGQADTSELKKIEPKEYGLRGTGIEYISVFATPAEDYYFRVFDLENMQCTAHHFDYADSELGPVDFNIFAQRFELTRRADCDQTASGGQQIVFYQFQEGYTVTTVWLNTDEKARVTWMGLTHAKNGLDCR